MNPTEIPDIPFSELSLEPIDDPGFTSVAALKLHPNSRTRPDRRANTSDRRQVLRFEADRRSGKSRRPQSVWEAGRAF